MWGAIPFGVGRVSATNRAMAKSFRCVRVYSLGNLPAQTGISVLAPSFLAVYHGLPILDPPKCRFSPRPDHRSRPSPFANAISFLFLVHSADLPQALQPPAEILHLHPMLDGGLPDAHFQLRQPLADLLDPDVPAQDSQRLRHRLVQRFRGYFDGVLGPGEVAAGDQAGAEGHAEKGCEDSTSPYQSEFSLLHIRIPKLLFIHEHYGIRQLSGRVL